MSILDYRITAQRDVLDLRASSVLEYERYAQDALVKSLVHHIVQTLPIKREVVNYRYDMQPRVRFSAELYLFTLEQLKDLIQSEISKAFIDAGESYAIKR